MNRQQSKAAQGRRASADARGPGGAAYCSCRIAIALYAQFGLGKFPANWWPLFYCVAAYVVVSTSMNVYLHYFEVDSFLICKPRRVSLPSLSLAVSHKHYPGQSL